MKGLELLVVGRRILESKIRFKLFEKWMLQITEQDPMTMLHASSIVLRIRD
jgi:hypothetical protein